jgi:hypothetical protein
MRNDMKPPLEWPTKYTRVVSTGTSASVSSRRPSRYATSSTVLPPKLQHASVAFQKRIPPASTVPSGSSR